MTKVITTFITLLFYTSIFSQSTQDRIQKPITLVFVDEKNNPIQTIVLSNPSNQLTFKLKDNNIDLIDSLLPKSDALTIQLESKSRLNKKQNQWLNIIGAIAHFLIRNKEIKIN